MRFRTWPVAALGLIGLLALIVVSLSTAYERARSAADEMDRINQRHRDIFTKLRGIQSDVYQSAIVVRDYLLDTDPTSEAEYRAEVSRLRDNNTQTMGVLAELLGEVQGGPEGLQRLSTALDEYWKAFEHSVIWNPVDRARARARFANGHVFGRRQALLALAAEVESLNDQSHHAQRAAVVARRTTFQQSLLTLLWQCLIGGILVSIVAVYRLRHLEGKQDEQREVAEAAERRMRGLSQQLVAAQEEERRKLSRELHDHVGQLLTGLRMSLGSVERANVAGRIPLLGDARRVVDDITRIVRDLASGLRPSMLDDFGLQPALEWLGRDVSRRCALPVSMVVDDGLEPLPDAHRTCIYRVVQEALTNAVKHSEASRIDVRVRRTPFSLTVTVSDDGRGFLPEVRTRGLGLRGLEERVKELDGSVRVETAPGRGTALVVHLPLPEEVPAARLAG